MTGDPGWPWASVPAGWQNLLAETLAALEAAAPSGYDLAQVKSKLGGLDVLVRAHDPEAQRAVGAVVLEAERRSRTVCERCGADGSTVSIRGWYSTLCPTHQAARMAETGRGARLIDTESAFAPIGDVMGALEELVGDEAAALSAQRARTAAHLAIARERYPHLVEPGPMTPDIYLSIQALLRGAGWSDNSILLWITSPNGRLQDWAAPSDVLASDPQAAFDAARAAAEGPP